MASGSVSVNASVIKLNNSYTVSYTCSSTPFTLFASIILDSGASFRVWGYDGLRTTSGSKTFSLSLDDFISIMEEKGYSVEYDTVISVEFSIFSDDFAVSEKTTVPANFIVYTNCKAPTSVSVNPASAAPETSVTLSWSGASSGTSNPITGYEIYRATSSTGTYTRITAITTRYTYGSVSVTAPATNGSSYYFKVLTVGTADGYDSGKSSVYATLTCSYSSTTEPTDVTLSESVSTGSNATLSWSGAKDGINNPITGYTVQRSESIDGSSFDDWSDLITTALTAIDVEPPVTAGNYYSFRVKSNGDFGGSDWTISSNTLWRDYTACGAPTSCSVSATLSLVAVTLSWSGATDGYGNPVSKYEVQRRSKAHNGSWSAWSALEVTSGTSLSVSPPATAGHYYQYRVRAQGTAGEAYYSEWKESTNTLRKAHQTIPAFTDPTLIVGQTDVKAIHITELQNAMNNILLPYNNLNTVNFTTVDKDSDAEQWGTHVQEIKSAIDSTGVPHEAWLALQDEITADVIDQIRRIVKSM